MHDPSRVQDLLEWGGFDHKTVRHFEAWSALEAAAASHIPGRETAKAVVVRDGNGRYMMAVVPATCHLDLAALALGSGHPDLELASEREVERLFPDCDPGAVPPFGALYDIPTFLDLCLCEAPQMFFTAGSRQELVTMRVADYVLATRAMVGQFCRHAGAACGES
jgi:Ala-tRNA(Pro) deacylase